MNLGNTSILGLSKIFEKGVVFLIYSIIAYVYGPSEFGEFVIQYTIGQFLFSLIDLGGELYQIRLFSQKNPFYRFQNVLILKLFIFLSVIIVALVTEQSIELILVSVIFFLESIISLIKSVFYINKLFVTESKISIVEKLVLLLVSGLIVSTQSPIIWIYITFIISKLIYLLVCFYLYFDKRMIASFRKSLNFKFSKTYISGSVSYIFHGLLTLIFFQIDILMLEYFKISETLIGQYSAAVKLFALGLVVNEVFFKQYYPLIVKLVDGGNKQKLLDYSNKIQLMNTWTGLAICVPIILFADLISNVSFGSDFSLTPLYLKLTCVVVFFRFVLARDSAILSSTNSNKYKVIASLLCSVVNITINFFLIPMHGVNGAIIATIITEFLLSILFMLIRHFLVLKIPINYNFLVGSILILMTVITSVLYELNSSIKTLIIIIAFTMIYFRRKIIFQSFYI